MPHCDNHENHIIRKLNMCDDMFHLKAEYSVCQTLHSFPLQWVNNNIVQSLLHFHLNPNEQYEQISNPQNFHWVTSSQSEG